MRRLKKLVPRSLFILRSKIELYRVDRSTCHSNGLASVRRIDLDAIFGSHVYHRELEVIEKEISLLSIPEDAGGVNPGDRRAIYCLIRHLQPRSVLEIGTHIGVSTVCIASALRVLSSTEGKEASHHLVTVDNRNVNDPMSRPWLKFGAKYAPIEILKRMGCGDVVRFITSDSLDYFSRREQEYDFIFLDGSHNSSTVYKEIPAATTLLQTGGYILLHDYFPNLRPLWASGAVVPGPYLAAQRLMDEGADIEVLPLGKLPWPTKLGSNLTSLALLGKSQSV